MIIIIDLIKKEIKTLYHFSSDICYRKIKINKNEILLVFNQSLSSSSSINNFILKNLSYLNISKKSIKNDFKNLIPADNIKEIKYSSIENYIANGFTIIIINDKKNILAIETKEDLSRSVEKPDTEATISGPKDSFNENYMTNIGLIRKRIKTANLVIEEKRIGRETKTKVAIAYMKNIIEKKLLLEIKQKLNKIDIDGILDSTYIKNIIVSKNTPFALIETTERPDLATMSLLDGKIIIIVENSPYVILIPTFFKDLFNSPEDSYQNNKNVSLTKIIRYFSFILALITPAFYIAITTYNHETIPLNLLVNFATQRQGVPFPAFVEAIGLSFVFEILKESDIRMPHIGGSAISILGAIVLGDAAVTAGIVSPIMVIVIAISSICSLMFSHVAMVSAIRWWKLYFMFFATLFGIPGIFLCGIILLLVLCDLKSFGKPYLYPFAPFNGKMIKDSLTKENIKKNNKRNPLLTDKNYTRSKL